MIKENDKDLFLTEDGELYFDTFSGDFELVEKLNNDLLINILKRRFQSSDYEWRLNSIISGDFDLLRGSSINQELVGSLRNLISSALSADFLLDPNNFQINILNIDKSTLGIGIIIFERDRSVDKQLFISFTYDYWENKLTPVESFSEI